MRAADFLDLFDCQRENYYVFSHTSERERDGKAEGRYRRVSETVTDDVIAKHLGGEISIGLIPTRRDKTCSWGCIDVDNIIYGKDPTPVIKKIREKKYPLMPYRSKTGGLHLVLHIKGSVYASDMRAKINELASDLGFGGEGADKFPAEDEIKWDPQKNEWRTGKCLNIPYQNSEFTTRYALNNAGQALDFEDYLEFVQQFRITPEQFKKIEIAKPSNTDEEWDQYPPCIQGFIKEGVGEGNRNNALFNMAVLAHLKNPKNLRQELYKRNETVCKPPVQNDSELEEIINGIKEQSYFYMCNTPIAKKFCNKELCRQRKFGIGPEQYQPTVDQFEKLDTDPPIYYLTIEGKQVTLTGQQLTQQQLFGTALFDQADMVWDALKIKDFKLFLRKLKDMQKVIEDMQDSKAHEFEYYVRKFSQDEEPGDDISQIEAGYIFMEEEWIYFKLETFMDFMVKNRQNKKRNEMIHYLRHGGAQNVKKNNTRMWRVKKPSTIQIKDRKVNFKKNSADDDNIPF